MEVNIYMLKNNATPVSWQLPIKGQLIEKFIEDGGVQKSLGLRRIQYSPGAESIFQEDIKGDLKPVRVRFERGVLRVQKSNVLLNTLLQKHNHFGKKYVLWSKENEVGDKLEQLRLKGEARQLIDFADKDKIKAIALTIKGYGANSWSDSECELYLREYADTKAKHLKELMSEKDYQSKLIASQSFVKGIITENEGKTAVIWADSKGVILNLAKGEKGILELGRFLSNRTDDSLKVLQSISDRLTALEVNLEVKEDKKGQSALEKENAELKAKLEALEKAQVPTEAKKVEVPNLSLETLDQARKDYLEVLEKEVPNNKKNDLDWILTKIAETKS